MRFGRTVEHGWLPAFSVGTEEEAKQLLTLTCELNLNGEYIAKELAVDQTLDNLYKFSDRLNEAHKALVKNGWCECKEITDDS